MLASYFAYSLALKMEALSELYGVTTQKAMLLIVTAMKTSKPTVSLLLRSCHFQLSELPVCHAKCCV